MKNTGNPSSNRITNDTIKNKGESTTRRKKANNLLNICTKGIKCI